jgi:hypothetical protein
MYFMPKIIDLERVKNRKEAVCRIMHIEDEDHVSRSSLLEKVVEMDKAIWRLYRELFFADPYHKYFDLMPDEIMNPLRTAAILRKGKQNG